MKSLVIIALFVGSFSAMAATPELDGRWTQYCDQSAKREENFAGNKVTLTERFYFDYSCEALASEVENIGTFVVDDEFRYPDQKVRNMDFTFEAVRMTLHSDDAITFYNDHAMCGMSDWKKGEAKDVTGKRCEFFQEGRPVQVPMKNDMRYGIYMLQDTRLYLGLLMPGFDGSVPQRRPYLLDQRYYVKVAE